MKREQLDGRYEIIRLIGSGGMGSVFEARHVRINRRVAVKLPHPQLVLNEGAVARFEREARIAGSIGHDHIVQVTDMGTTYAGTPFIVMEYLEGKNLLQLLQQQCPLPPVRAVRILMQALSAVQAAHDAGIVHRDLKPENIFLVDRPNRADFVKVLDFGVAKLLSAEGGLHGTLTQAGYALGTPHYMAPEQAAGADEITTLVDVYALGAVLYLVLTGRLPFEAPNLNALLMKISNETPPRPESLNPALPPQLSDLILKAMAREPQKRFASCDELRAQLKKFLNEMQLSSVAPPNPPQPVAEGKSHDVLFVGVRPPSDSIQEDGTPLRMQALADTAWLLGALEKSVPHLIVSNVAIEPDAIRRRLPTFQSAMILIDMLATHRELTLYSWDYAADRYAETRAPLAELADKISAAYMTRKRLCDQRAVLGQVSMLASVRSRSEVFRIETSVVIESTLHVLTRIWSDVGLVATTTQSLGALDELALEHVRAVADLQHSMAVERARAGKHDRAAGNPPA